MQASHPQEFQAGIFSNDPVEYNAAVNLYVEASTPLTEGLPPHASYISSLISTHGASKIKNILALKKLFIRETRVDKRKSVKSPAGGAKWDEDSQVYFVPTLTTYGLPFALPIIDLSFTFPTSLTLHLNMTEESDIESVDEDDFRWRSRSGADSNSSGEREKRYVITKWEERGPVDSIIGFGGKTIQKLHVLFLRPMTTLILLLLAGAKHFVHTHPLSDGIFNFLIAAIVTFVTEARDIVLAELSSKHPRMVYHTDNYSKTIKRSTHSAQSSISSAVDSRITARPQSPASSVKSRKSVRAPFRPPSAGSPTTSASTVFATGAVSKKPHDLTEKEHASFAEVVKEGDLDTHGGHSRTTADGGKKKKKGDEPRKRSTATTNVDEGHPSYAQVVVEGDEEHHHQPHQSDEHHHRQEHTGSHSHPDPHDHDDHASYAEVAADGVVAHEH